MRFVTGLEWFRIVLENRDGAVVRALASHQCGTGSIPVRVWGGFVVGSRLALRIFCRFSGFLLSTNTNIPTFNLTRIENPQ